LIPKDGFAPRFGFVPNVGFYGAYLAILTSSAATLISGTSSLTILEILAGGSGAWITNLLGFSSSFLGAAAYSCCIFSTLALASLSNYSRSAIAF